jgi:hypothetical protein
MTLVLLLGASGTIVPIVLAAGGLMLAAASLLGAWLGWEIAGARSRGSRQMG